MSDQRKNYIFDFGNVLMRFDPDELTAACVSDESLISTISKAVFDRFYWDKLDEGSITDEEVKSAVCQRLPSALHGIACEVYDRWVENLTPIAGMKDILSYIKNNGGKLYLVSNISKGFAAKYTDVPEVYGILSKFDGLVFSGPIGITKPNREIFEHLLEKYGLDAKDCVFIDDSPINIAGAEAVGIKGYLFNGDADALRGELF